MRTVKRIVRVVWVPLLWCLVPASAWAAGGESSWGWIETIGRWTNLLVLFGAIYIFTRAPIRHFLTSRREDIAREISAARVAREAAERQLAEMDRRMAQLDSELEALRREAEEEARLERERILSQAESEAEKILASATREIDGLSRAARQELKAYAAQLSVQLAREQVAAALDAGARDRIVDRFIVSLGATREEKS